jgi:hypothetical protein
LPAAPAARDAWRSNVQICESRVSVKFVYMFAALWQLAGIAVFLLAARI